MRTKPDFQPADWPAPAGVHAGTTLRDGGVSQAPYDSFNLGDHVGDAPQAVADNRRRLRDGLRLPAEPAWLQQVHGTTVVNAAEQPGAEADAGWASRPGTVCAILTADCLPVLFCDRQASCWAAAHAGWRGLAAGVLEATVAQLPVPTDHLLAWLGPAIGPAAFEVGPDVRAAFCRVHPEDSTAFVHGRPGKYQADIYALARARLHRLGLDAVYGGGGCTVSDAGRYYSYRRERRTGRMASLIWRDPD